MSRRDHGPKRRAERYAYRVIDAAHTVRNWTHEDARKYLVDAYMAGYGSASRARRKPGATVDMPADEITRSLEMLNDALSGTGRPGDHE